ncbi:hypothetical protein A1Q2_03390 [Trichosporon asahii var. asahii CBS 8904]|uniref:Uncharacterized protein n=1 Tax=Trichosporon asahii var. asahii (strain CBS 8904) TaxID=1220162 RepID=K1WMI3_TRIAC|nr:hypothetical protein A1Q2_03390 [Trichosporon asahii var. asahii CBS 8904]
MVAAQDYTDLSRSQLVISFSLVTSLFFLWGLSYGLLDFAYFVAYLVVAPPMGTLMRRIGYKWGIHIGLTLFSIGAILFWPSAVYHQYGMFVAFTFLCGSGMATLETAANSYIVVLGPPKFAAFRLTLAQSFNGIATVIGPLIASRTFFNEDLDQDGNQLGTVQYVYLAMALFALCLNIGLAFCKLPEVRQAVKPEHVEFIKKEGYKGILKKYHTVFGFFAEFFYVGAQVAVASMAIFYITRQPGINPPISNAHASDLFSVCQAVFTIGRFVGVAYLRYIDSCFALFVHGSMLILPSATPSSSRSATSNLGPYATFGGGLLSAGVSGGAAWPSAQAALLHRVSAQRSYLVAMAGFVPLMTYGLVMWIVKCKRLGRWTILNRHLDGAVDHVPHSSDYDDRISEPEKEDIVMEESKDGKVAVVERL